MREHQFDAEEAGLRPKASRIEEPVTDQVGRAAAEGRPDVLGEAGHDGPPAGRRQQRGQLDGRGRTVAGARRDQLGRPAARARRTRGHGGPARRTTSATCGCTTTPPRTGRPQAVNAHAYTVGSNIVFQRDKYDPGVRRRPDDARPRADPRRPAAQRAGRRHPDRRRDQGQRPVGPLRARGRRQRRARDVRARARRSPLPRHRRRPRPSSGDADEEAPPVQRDEAPEEEEEETAQGSFVQREEAPEEEQEEEPAG